MEERRACEMKWVLARQVTAVRSAEPPLQDAARRHPVRQLPAHQQDAAL